MKKKKAPSEIAFILSIIGFLTGFIIIGIILDIIAIVLAVKSIRRKDEKIRLGYIAIVIACVGILATSYLYSSVNNKNDLSQTPQVTDKKEVEPEAKGEESKFDEQNVVVEKNIPKNVIEEKEGQTKVSLQSEPVAANVTINENKIEYNGSSYKIIEVDGGNRSGSREANVAVDIGYGDRVYWGLTNEFGQLVYVIANQVILQDDNTEPVNSKGRYYDDEANVPGTERSNLDQGHVIADSLGGVSNAYNITPQDSTLNRHGDQAYMEKVIRDAGGCTNFVAKISYPDTTTQIPSTYKYQYTLKGNKITDEFPNENPEKSIEESNLQQPEESIKTANTSGVQSETARGAVDEQAKLSQVDTNGNGKVTISEAKKAGYSMPIYSDHWLYKYMDDRDGDGVVGE